MNPDAEGRPLPTVIEIVQLKGRSAIERADFADVFRSPKDALGEEWLRTDELMVDPGQVLSKWLERDPKTSYVAAVGVFRQPSGTTWRAVVPVPLVPTSQCQPQQGPRLGFPTENDFGVRVFLEDFRLTAEVTPQAASVQQAPSSLIADRGL